MDKEKITPEQVASLINKYLVVGLDGEPYYGGIDYKFKAGHCGNFILNQNKKVEDES